MTREAVRAGAATAMVVMLLLGLPHVSTSATVTVSIFGVDGNDGGREGDDHEGDNQGNQGGDPNPACVGAATCAYNPNPLTLAVGDSINFTNLGGMKHTATGPLSFSPTLKDVVQPGGGSCPSDPGVNGNCFSTGKMKRDASQTIGPFNATSGFDYYCEIHGPGAMLGTLNVGGGGGTSTTTVTTTTSTGATTSTTSPTTSATTSTSTTTAGSTTTTAATTTSTSTTTSTAAATTTTAAPTTTTTTTTTGTAPTTTTTTAAVPSTTTTTTGVSTSTTTTAPSTTTTTLAACTTHDVVVQLPSSQPPMKVASYVNVSVIVTNVGSCPETAHVTLSGTIDYTASQSTTVPPGGSRTLLFQYPVPVRLEVTLTASGPLTGDGTPANNSETRTYPTSVL